MKKKTMIEFDTNQRRKKTMAKFQIEKKKDEDNDNEIFDGPKYTIHFEDWQENFFLRFVIKFYI